MNESKFPWAESTDTDHVSHYSKTASPYSAAFTTNNNNNYYSALFVTMISMLLIHFQMF